MPWYHLASLKCLLKAPLHDILPCELGHCLSRSTCMLRGCVNGSRRYGGVPDSHQIRQPREWIYVILRRFRQFVRRSSLTEITDPFPNDGNPTESFLSTFRSWLVRMDVPLHHYGTRRNSSCQSLCTREHRHITPVSLRLTVPVKHRNRYSSTHNSRPFTRSLHITSHQSEEGQRVHKPHRMPRP